MGRANKQAAETHGLNQHCLSLQCTTQPLARGGKPNCIEDMRKRDWKRPA